MGEEKKDSSLVPPSSSLIPKLRRALRGEVDARTVALETLRRASSRLRQRGERAHLAELEARPARLRAEYAKLETASLLEHFRHRTEPKLFAGFDAASREQTARAQRELFPTETARLLREAERICEHRWELLGYGERELGREEIGWHTDPVSGIEWPLAYHADISLARGDGSDARVLWELNRLAHFITLGRAYALTQDERYSAEFFAQLESWRERNPLGRGANWTCAMEVALRAMNLLAAFWLFRRSPALNERRLLALLQTFEQHGEHIVRNLEFSYITTSNHYLSDVVGLVWLGLALPELAPSRAWRERGLREMLSEMDKQVLEDGADAEASTGYHRFVLELFLYTFLLCRANGVEIAERYWQKLHAMLEYVRAYLQPTGRAPLIGDTDSGQVMPIKRRKADEHLYVLALGAAVFREARFKIDASELPEELLWFLGTEGLRDYQSLSEAREPARSRAFERAGTYILRDGDLYLLLNASGAGLNGRGSHGHNDALSLEVSACGRSFIVDPGTYVYTSDPGARHLFRSTAYHSTIEVDGAEQNVTDPSLPFVIGDEARARLVSFETAPARDLIIAEHAGYTRLADPVTHRRAVEFDKRERYWLIEDTLTGDGEHTFHTRFHLDCGLEVTPGDDRKVLARDRESGARLLIAALDAAEPPALDGAYVSRDYGERTLSFIASWTTRASVPLRLRWLLVPICASEDEGARRELVARFSKA